MEQLTLETVQEAFIRTGLTPVEGWGDAMKTGCVMTVLWRDRRPKEYERALVDHRAAAALWGMEYDDFSPESEVEKWAIEQMGEYYASGIIRGWDGDSAKHVRLSFPGGHVPFATIAGYEHGALFCRVIREGQPIPQVDKKEAVC